MRRYGPLVVVIIIAIVAIVGISLANHNKSATNTATNNAAANSSANPAPQSSSGSANSTTPAAADKVSITNFAFSPDHITVKKGTTVTWTNNDSTAHRVVGDSGSNPSGLPVDPGKSVSFTFNSAGTFTYHCSIHSSMHGTVTVTE